MGTYTTNYNLFMPTVGENGWGELVNGNFTTIDATMKGFDDVLSKMTWDGDNVTFPGSVAANGGFNGINLSTKITTESGVISGIYMSNNVTLLSRSDTGTSTGSFTYKTNPICNNVYFKVRTPAYNTKNDGRIYITINGETWYDTGSITHSNELTTDMIELKDNDVIFCSLYCSNPSNGYVVLACGGYLVNI